MRDLNLYPPSFCIISAHTGKNSYDDFRNTQRLRDLLLNLYKTRNIYFKDINGCYKGKEELSFYVEGLLLEEVFTLAKQFEQESVLYVNECRQAYLECTNGCDSTFLGDFVQVPEWKALSEQAYSYDTVNGGYYICTNDPRFTDNE